MTKKRDRSDHSHAVLDQQSRYRKANKILSVLSAYTDLEDKELLDLGTGSGYMASRFAEKCKSVTSVDVVDERRVKSGYNYCKVRDEALPFKDESFDIVISNHVIEHVQDQTRHIGEIKRVLKDGGYIYLATPNKYWISDPHYRLPFLPIMSKVIGTQYIKLLKRGKEWDVQPVSPILLNKFIHPFDARYVVPQLLKYPEKFELDMMQKVTSISKYFPDQLLKSSHYMSPTLIYIARKNISFEVGS